MAAEPAERLRQVAAASHDLRQSLQAASVQAHALGLQLRRQALPRADDLANLADLADLASLADAVQQALQHCSAQLAGLLDLARSDAEPPPPNLHAVDLPALLDELQRSLAPLAAQRGLTLTLQQATTAITVCSDATLLRRLLQNLLGNALQHSQVGRVQLALGVAADSGEADASDPDPPAGVWLSITDAGPGLTPAQQARLQGAAGNPVDAGAATASHGLGLGIVHRLAQQLGIRLHVSSPPGGGTNIRLHWPGAASNPLTSAAATPCSTHGGPPPA